MELAPDITPDDLIVFLQEAEEHLQLLDESILKLERGGEDAEVIQEIFRAAHTLKGSSAMLGYTAMAELAHAMESLLDRVRRGDLKATTQAIDALLGCLDVLRALTDALSQPDGDPVAVEGALEALKAAVAEQDGVRPSSEHPGSAERGLVLDEAAEGRVVVAQAGGKTVQHIRIELEQTTEWAVVRCYQIIEELRGLGEIIASNPSLELIDRAEVTDTRLEVVLATSAEPAALSASVEEVPDIAGIAVSPYERSNDGPPERKEGPPTGGDNAPKRSAALSQTMRIDVERLDSLMNVIGELVIDRTRLLQVAKMLESRYQDDDLLEALGKTTTHIAKVVDELQEDIMKVRMLPIGTVFNSFPRMMRDLAQKMKKKLDFQVKGQDTEIDRSVIEHIRDPVVHLLRNALDHGVESAQQRKSAGKPEAARITLDAYHEQSHIVISIEDDGKGIDPEALRDAGVKKGLLSREAAARLNEAETMDLIFLPGYTTAKKTTDVSGRGVGMDIVKTNIEAINGLVLVSSRPGEGTTFTLRLPLTLATVQALLVSIGPTVYAIPLVHILETVSPDPAQIHTMGGREVMRLRDAIIPLVRLSDAFGLGQGARSDDSGKGYVVVVRSGERSLGLVVDGVRVQQEVVAKSMGAYIGEIKGLSGASVLGDGQVVLIVDVPSLVQVVTRGGRTEGPSPTRIKSIADGIVGDRGTAVKAA